MERKLLIAALLAGCAYFVWEVVEQRRAEKYPYFATAEQFISFGCDHALADAEQYHHITLDYSVASLKQVDQILGQAHDAYVKNPASVSVPGMSMEYGAYVGEVIRRNAPGSYWTRDSQVMGEQSYPLHWNGGESFPFAWCSKRITYGEEDSIWIKYTLMKNPDWKKNLKVATSKTR